MAFSSHHECHRTTILQPAQRLRTGIEIRAQLGIRLDRRQFDFLDEAVVHIDFRRHRVQELASREEDRVFERRILLAAQRETDEVFLLVGANSCTATGRLVADRLRAVYGEAVA